MTSPAFSLEDPLLTVDDVAAALGLNEQTIRNYIDDGVLPGVRVGNRRVQMRRSALDAFLAAGETPDLVRGLAALDEARGPLARALPIDRTALARGAVRAGGRARRAR